MSAFDDLNREQRQAVEMGDGPVAIIAGPGTGKTKTLVARIQYLVMTKRTDPKRILALTFTKKASDEMRARLNEIPVHVATFHALCHDLLHEELHVITEHERVELIKKLTRPAAFKALSGRELGLVISCAKNTLVTSPELENLLSSYNRALTDGGYIDFDDILLKAKISLEQNNENVQAIRNQYDYILIDEFQDTNNLQYELLRLIRGNDNLFVIGDPMQSIYGFRGASGGIFDRFFEEFPQAQQITLSANYR